MIPMVLIHDLVEIDAGDTYAYDEAGKATQREREVKAADRIFSILPEEQGKALRALWEEFEARAILFYIMKQIQEFLILKNQFIR